jgi:hypothetical protein
MTGGYTRFVDYCVPLLTSSYGVRKKVDFFATFAAQYLFSIVVAFDSLSAYSLGRQPFSTGLVTANYVFCIALCLFSYRAGQQLLRNQWGAFSHPLIWCLTLPFYLSHYLMCVSFAVVNVACYPRQLSYVKSERVTGSGSGADGTGNAFSRKAVNASSTASSQLLAKLSQLAEPGGLLAAAVAVFVLAYFGAVHSSVHALAY